MAFLWPANLPFPMSIEDMPLTSDFSRNFMKESKQCGNCVGIFSFLSETSTVLCVVLCCRGGGACCIGARCSLHGRHRERVTGSFISSQMEAIQVQCSLSAAQFDACKLIPVYYNLQSCLFRFTWIIMFTVLAKVAKVHGSIYKRQTKTNGQVHSWAWST